MWFLLMRCEEEKISQLFMATFHNDDCVIICDMLLEFIQKGVIVVIAVFVFFLAIRRAEAADTAIDSETKPKGSIEALFFPEVHFFAAIDTAHKLAEGLRILDLKIIRAGLQIRSWPS